MEWIKEFAVWLAEHGWPVHIVREYESAVHLRAGRYLRTLGPGWWCFVPFIDEIISVEIVPALFSTPLQIITLSDGRTLTYSATVSAQVTDARKALLAVDRYRETTAELVMSVLAERLAKVDARRLDPESRGRLLADLKMWLHDACSAFGVDVLSVRFTNFAIGLRAYRVLSQSATDGGAL